jgi:hypothetical protein
MLFHYFQIHPKELGILREVFHNRFAHKSKTIRIRLGLGKKKTFRQRTSGVNDTDARVIEIAKKYLERYYFDLDIDKSNKHVEIYYNSHIISEKTEFQPLSAYHKDDDFLRYNSHTIVFYLNKSVQDAGLRIALNGNEHVVDVQEGFAAVFRGDMYHKVEAAQTPGIRNALVVHFPRKD